MPTVTQNAHCEPLVNAFANGWPLFTRWLKWVSETDDVTASPIAPPIC